MRVTLRATRMDILRLIADEGVRLIALDGLLGLGAALATAQLLKSLMFNVGPYDPLTYAAVALLLALVALVATLIPARAAMKAERWWRCGMSSMERERGRVSRRIRVRFCRCNCFFIHAALFGLK